MISESLREQVESVFGQPIKNIQPVAGGSINKAAAITITDNCLYFLKWNTAAPADMFAKEERGLQLLQSAQSGLRIPEAAGSSGTTADGTGFLVMEWIQEGAAQAHSAAALGRGLARLHQSQAAQYGLDHPNYIGSLPQSNRQYDTWIDFFVKERLEPQLRRAVDGAALPSSVDNHFKNLYRKLPEILTDEPPGLLHGDLWGGNYLFDENGEPVIYDPAVYYGNREIEMAFTHLFGGFPKGFYTAYQEAYPLTSGFKARKDIYNLYPLLVHTNLFGGHYGRQVQSIVQHY